MKNLKRILLTLVLIGGMASCSSQRTVVRVYPKHGTVVTTLRTPKTVIHNRTNYYLADGVWYKARGKKFVVVGAPTGIKVRTLPRGHKIVMVKGRKLYKYKGIWYKKSGRNFVVVNV